MDIRDDKVSVVNVQNFNFNMPTDIAPLAKEYDIEWGQTGKALEIQKFLEVTKNKKVLIDVGGFCGFVSMFFVMSEPGRQAHSFEPNFNFIRNFMDICKLNEDINILDNITMYPILIGEQEGEAPVTKMSGIGMYSVFNRDKRKESKIFAYNPMQDLVSDDQWPKIKMSTVDIFSFFLLNKKNILPDVIKIDVEGYEQNVLLGAQKVMTSNSKPYVFIEVHKKHLFEHDHSIEDVYNTILDYKYNIYDINMNIIDGYNHYEDFFEAKNENHFVCLPKG